MADRIKIPDDELQKLMEETEGLSDDDLKALAEKYANSGSGYVRNDKTRMREAIRRRRQRLIIEAAREKGLLPKPTRGPNAEA